MKNFIYKIMTSFHKPIKPLTFEQREKIIIQMVAYYEEIADCKIKMAFSETLEQLTNHSIKRAMAEERVRVLKIKLYKGCDCGRDHTLDIESEERLKELFSQRLLKFIDEIKK